MSKTKGKRLSPLVLVAILAVLAVGGLATWYWTSQSISTTITVTGWMTAKTNFDPLVDMNDGLGNLVDFADLVTMDELILGDTIGRESGKYYLYVRAGDTNAEDVYLSVMATFAPEITVTANVYLAGVTGAGEFVVVADNDLGPIAINGTQSIQIATSGNPLWLFMPGDPAPLIEIEFTIAPGTLGIGSYPVSIEVSLGDSL